jgi:hypothetical protein
VTVEYDPLAIAVTVARHLEALGIVYTIGGSIASSVAGEPRSTLDIDIVVGLAEAQVSDLVSALEQDFYVVEDALRRAVRDTSSANLIHQASQVKVDLFVAGGTPLDSQQLKRRLSVDVGGGRFCTCTRRKISCSRSFGGSGRVARHRTASGAISSGSFAYKANDWTGTTWRQARRSSTSPTCWSAPCENQREPAPLLTEAASHRPASARARTDTRSANRTDCEGPSHRRRRRLIHPGVHAHRRRGRARPAVP